MGCDSSTLVSERTVNLLVSVWDDHVNALITTMFRVARAKSMDNRDKASGSDCLARADCSECCSSVCSVVDSDGSGSPGDHPVTPMPQTPTPRDTLEPPDCVSCSGSACSCCFNSCCCTGFHVTETVAAYGARAQFHENEKLEGTFINYTSELSDDNEVDESDDLTVSNLTGSVSSSDLSDPSDTQELRAPLYNVEDYIVGIRKFAKLPALQLYVDNTSGGEKKAKKRNKFGRNERAEPAEMSMKQFSNVSELLKKLRLDLRLSFPSFVREFVSDPYDGATALLDLLKNIQLSQTEFSVSGCGSVRSRQQHHLYRGALYDEHDCLLCLRHCLRCDSTLEKLIDNSHALYTVSVCTMSNNSRSRVLALELLTVACSAAPDGHRHVIEAVSTLRLRFGEPVRFKFLVGMLNSPGAQSFQTACLRFFNRLLETCSSRGERVHLQTELEEAGFCEHTIRQCLDGLDSDQCEPVLHELQRWRAGHLDVDQLCNTVQHSAQQSGRLSQQIAALQHDVKKGELLLQKSRSSEKQLRNRLGELQRQIEFYKQQLLLTRDECGALSRRLLVTAASGGGGGQCGRCSNQLQLVSGSLDGSKSCSSSSVSDSSCDVIRRTETQPAKHNIDKPDSAVDKRNIVRDRLEADDFESDKICSDVIEVHDNTIAYVPSRTTSTQTTTAPCSVPRSNSSAKIDGATFGKHKSQPVISSSQQHQQQQQQQQQKQKQQQQQEAEIEEAIGQLTAVLHEAETSIASDDKTCAYEASTASITSFSLPSSSSPSSSSSVSSSSLSARAEKPSRRNSGSGNSRGSGSGSSGSGTSGSGTSGSGSGSRGSGSGTSGSGSGTSGSGSGSGGRRYRSESVDAVRVPVTPITLSHPQNRLLNPPLTTAASAQPPRRRSSVCVSAVDNYSGKGAPRPARSGDSGASNGNRQLVADRTEKRVSRKQLLQQLADDSNPPATAATSIKRSGSFCGVTPLSSSKAMAPLPWHAVRNTDRRQQRPGAASSQTKFGGEFSNQRGFIARGHVNDGRYSRTDGHTNGRSVARSASRSGSREIGARVVPGPDYATGDSPGHEPAVTAAEARPGSIMDLTSALY